ncbi:endonuclease/exonuclease/phosphatase family protein [Mycobacterium deserti]|uniref:Endonuclease/exonuclease/phosphatase family protein n=1 Tax=Mycobacterium deserti TaxID=2978347 RepID=A0ABT2MIL0_9MYCO|nr:endonuclease/exonuclease/phosphatase family protein [Mycobacterium deserti]MCT7662106.1 endonuclease/exonuclease/phosphatase family protein [Mycobacterium deserti]
MRPRTRKVDVRAFDPESGRWVGCNGGGSVDRDELTVSTYNVWFDSKCADLRFRHIAELLSRDSPDVMVFQEVTAEALKVFLAQRWIRDDYACAAVVDDEVGKYGMLLLSRLPIRRVVYTRLPTKADRGLLRAEFMINGGTTAVCSVHLDSGKRSRWIRGWQLRAVFRALRDVENALIMGDFNMRDDENERIAEPYRDVWPTLRPDDDGFTEDTSINLMRYDMKDKHRHVRFDRVLLKGRDWVPEDIELLGTEPISKKHPRIFPSDHFGLRCRIRRGKAGSGVTARVDARRPRPPSARAR